MRILFLSLVAFGAALAPATGSAEQGCASSIWMEAGPFVTCEPYHLRVPLVASD